MVNFLMQVVLKVLIIQGEMRPCGFLSWPCIALMAALCSFSRSNCVYIVIPTLLAVALQSGHGKRRAAIAATVSVAVVFAGWSYVVLPFGGIEKGNVREALSLPLLQVAKVVDLHKGSIASEDRETLQDVCSVSIEELGDLYSHRTADFVKFKFSFEGNELEEWLKTYIRLGIRYPNDYLYVLLETNYGYLYPAPPQGYAGLSSEIDPITNIMINQQFLDRKSADAVDLQDKLYNLSPVFPGARDWLSAVIKVANSFPFTWVVFAPAVYIWLCAMLLAYIAQRKKPGLLLVVPLGLLLLVCLVSPLNGSIRYALPCVYLLPFILGCAASPLSIKTTPRMEIDRHRPIAETGDRNGKWG